MTSEDENIINRIKEAIEKGTIKGFDDCKMERTKLIGRDFSDYIFVDCNLFQADFRQANLTNVKFIRCDLRSAIFLEAIMEGVELIESVWS